MGEREEERDLEPMVKKFLPDSGCRCRRSLCVVRCGDRACVRSRMIGLRRMSGAVVAAASMLEEKAGGTGADGGNTPCLAHASLVTRPVYEASRR